MQFQTATEYRVHLRELIADRNLVEQAVRAKFPQASRRISRQELKDTGKKAPSKFDPWIGSDAKDKADRENIKIGSQRLLAAIWKAHPNILKRLASQGLRVVQP